MNPFIYDWCVFLSHDGRYVTGQIWNMQNKQLVYETTRSTSPRDSNWHLYQGGVWTEEMMRKAIISHVISLTRLKLPLKIGRI